MLEESIAGDLANTPELGEKAVAAYSVAGDSLDSGRVLVRLADFQSHFGDLARSEATLYQAIQVLEPVGETSLLAEAYLLLPLIAKPSIDRTTALEYADRAIAIALRQNDPKVESMAWSEKARLIGERDYDAALELHDRAIDSAGLLGSTTTTLSRALTAATHHALDHDAQRSRGFIEERLRIAREQGQSNLEALALADRAWLNLRTGAWREAETDADGALEILTINDHPHIDEPLLLLTLIRMRQGRPWRATLEEGRAAATDLHPLRASYWWLVMAEHAWLSQQPFDEYDRAMEEVDQLARANRWAGSQLAFWLWKLGGLGARDYSVKGHRQQIEGAWEAAASHWEDLQAPYDTAIALFDGDQEAKLRALQIADDLQANTLASRIRQDLRASGVRGIPRRPNRSTREHAAGLTVRQSEVLRLLSKGYSNARIADELFISVRTAEHHVAALIAKIEAQDREDAVRLALEKGLIADPDSSEN